MHGRSKHAPKHMSLANESKPDRKAVIVLTCCALQSACYSPTGIVILFILAQFQGEVQTNLTVKRAKNALFHRARRFRMPAAIGLRHPASASCLGRHLRLAGRCPNNSSLLPPLAAVVVVALWAFSAENHLIFRVSGKSADFPETHFHRRGRKEEQLVFALASSPSPSRLAPCHLSQRERPWQRDEVCVDCQGLSLWESCHRR